MPTYYGDTQLPTTTPNYQLQLPSGMYNVQVMGNGNLMNRKIVINH